MCSSLSSQHFMPQSPSDWQEFLEDSFSSHHLGFSSWKIHCSRYYTVGSCSGNSFSLLKSVCDQTIKYSSRCVLLIYKSISMKAKSFSYSFWKAIEKNIQPSLIKCHCMTPIYALFWPYYCGALLQTLASFTWKTTYIQSK